MPMPMATQRHPRNALALSINSLPPSLPPSLSLSLCLSLSLPLPLPLPLAPSLRQHELWSLGLGGGGVRER